MKRIFAPLLAALLLTACAAKPETSVPGGYELYFAARTEKAAGADAICADTFPVADGAALDTEALAEILLTALLEAPDDAALSSPFPEGTRLQKLRIAGGRATVDLSEEYARLSGIDLSVADACVTLTLTQLDGIYAVRITADGRELPYRETQLMTAADALLSSGEAAIRPINVSLYFLDTQTGALRAQAQSLALYEGQTRVNAVLEALRHGPSDDDSLQALLDDGFGTPSSHVEEGVCYVNLGAAAGLPEDEPRRALALESLARSLLSLDGISEVRILSDGEDARQWTAAFMPTEPEET